MKGIVRSMKPNQKFFERSWESFYKLYLHMKYGQGMYCSCLLGAAFLNDDSRSTTGHERIRINNGAFYGNEIPISN